MTETNPFKSPVGDDGSQSKSVWSGPINVVGNLLVVSSGVVLPWYCVKTGTPISERQLQKKDLIWTPRYVIIIIALLQLIGIIAYFLLRKRCKITYGLSTAIKRKYAIRFFLALITLITSIGLAIFARVTHNLNALGVAVPLFFASMLAIVFVCSPLRVRSYEGGQFWIAGCSPEFLERLKSEPPKDQFQFPWST